MLMETTLQKVLESVFGEVLPRTPERLLEAWREMAQGADLNPVQIMLSAKMPSSERGTRVCVTGIPFSSTCAHHILPFYGQVDVEYVAGDYIVGLSKLPRAVQALASRLQLQETLTCEIASAVSTALEPQSVRVVIRASHSCMSCRGVRSRCETVTEKVLRCATQGATKIEGESDKNVVEQTIALANIDNHDT